MALRKSNWTAVVLTLISITALPVIAMADCPLTKAAAAPRHPCCPKPKPATPLPAQCFAGCLTAATEPVLHAHMKLMGLDDALPIWTLGQQTRTAVDSINPSDPVFYRRNLYILLRVLRR